jgi:hypothetical protein
MDQAFIQAPKLVEWLHRSGSIDLAAFHGNSPAVERRLHRAAGSKLPGSACNRSATLSDRSLLDKTANTSRGSIEPAIGVMVK